MNFLKPTYLILPLLFMMFAFEFILLTNATLRHYEELVNKDYNIVASSAELDKNKLSKPNFLLF